MLEIQNVSKTFNAGTVNQKIALNGLNLKLNEGDFVTVIGGNGAGKSTMLNAVAGVWPVDEGKILIDGVDADLAEVMKKLAKDKMLRALSNVAYAKGDYEKEMGQAALKKEAIKRI